MVVVGSQERVVVDPTPGGRLIGPRNEIVTSLIESAPLVGGYHMHFATQLEGGADLAQFLLKHRP